jgi:flagellar basal body P-ring formation protein FlgA
MRRAWILVLVLGLAGPAAAGNGGLTLPAGAPLTLSLTEELLSAALIAAGAGEALDLRLEQPRLPLANQSAEATEIAVEALRYEPESGRFSALLVGAVGGQVRFRLPAEGRAQELISLPVLVRPVAAGEVIAAADVDWMTATAGRLRPNSVTAATQLIGAEARRPLQPGRMLSVGDLQAPRLVLRGRAVQLIYARPGLKLSALGLAQTDGALGDLVRVVNADSRRQLQGVVIGPDRVAFGGADLPPAGGSRLELVR